ncbi:MAG: hypothetical protein Q8P71_01940 [bacterium]|nr:hypothetical protein [bacterium]
MKKLHELSERTRIIILWTATLLIAVGLLAWWVGSVSSRWQNVGEESIQEQKD